MYLVDANVVLEVLYKRSRWEESYRLLNAVKEGSLRVYMLHYAIHGISSILGAPDLVAELLSELLSWKGLTVADLALEEELAASRMARNVGLDFDDGLHYYFAKSRGVPIVSFDKDFDKTDITRLEPREVLQN
ncbi:MAG: PIN domain-containing protein [Desulfurococcales archaeon]|nr:PIN domain-containing protein [Desulfurococcales archaeon]